MPEDIPEESDLPVYQPQNSGSQEPKRKPDYGLFLAFIGVLLSQIDADLILVARCASNISNVSLPIDHRLPAALP